jgi:hypothetical protein
MEKYGCRKIIKFKTLKNKAKKHRKCKPKFAKSVFFVAILMKIFFDGKKSNDLCVESAL